VGNSHQPLEDENGRFDDGFSGRKKRAGPETGPALSCFPFVPAPVAPHRSPARTGRHHQAQVKPVGPQLEAEDALPEPALDPVRTLTEVKLRSTSSEPHWGQGGLFPFPYSDMDIRTSKGKLQYWHL